MHITTITIHLILVCIMDIPGYNFPVIHRDLLEMLEAVAWKHVSWSVWNWQSFSAHMISPGTNFNRDLRWPGVRHWTVCCAMNGQLWHFHSKVGMVLDQMHLISPTGYESSLIIIIS